MRCVRLCRALVWDVISTPLPSNRWSSVGQPIILCDSPTSIGPVSSFYVLGFSMMSLLRFVSYLSVLVAVAGPAIAAERPNVVWLVSEYNSVHYMKLFNEHGAQTPRIAELATHGLI